MSEEERVTLAVLRADLRHVIEILTSGFIDVKADQAAMNVQLKLLNGSARENRDAIIRHEAQIGSLERFKDILVKCALSGIGAGVGLGAVLFGMGKAAGWW